MWRLISLLEGGKIPVNTENDDINNLLKFLDETVDTYILPIIYAVLALFLVVKGALLGVQIVKAADEPQVRQEKINSLKWLVIGVAITFLVVIAADVVLGAFLQAKGEAPTTTTEPKSFLFK